MVVQPVKKGRNPMSERRAKRLYRRFNSSRFTRRAEKMANSDASLRKLRKTALRLSLIVKKARKKVRRILDYIFGKDSDWGTRIQAIAALVYFISPLDFVPDIIPGVGYLEDIAIMAMVIGMITSRLIRKEQNLNISEITQTVKEHKRDSRNKINRQNTSISSIPIFSSLFRRAKQDVVETVDDSMKKQVRTRLIIVIISLSGAILMVGIALLLKYKFGVFS